MGFLKMTKREWGLQKQWFLCGGGGGVARERSYSTRTARSILPYSYGVRRVIQIIHKI